MSKQNRMEILDSVKRIICGDRDERYGEPEYCFSQIADYWTTYLAHNFTETDRSLTGHDVAIMMALFKIARIETALATDCDYGTSVDSWLDAIGYLACGLDGDEPNYSKKDKSESDEKKCGGFNIG